MRRCAICGTELQPFHEDTLTAHEFDCYKQVPVSRIPKEHLDKFKSTVQWEVRSHRAKAAARKRKTNKRG